MPTCPHCKKEIIDRLEFEKFVATKDKERISTRRRKNWRAVAYVCPHCDVILGVGLDPQSLAKN